MAPMIAGGMILCFGLVPGLPKLPFLLVGGALLAIGFALRKQAREQDEADAQLALEEAARPAPGVLDALARADLIVVAPSNPFISIWPILAVGEIRQALEARSSKLMPRARMTSASRVAVFAA